MSTRTEEAAQHQLTILLQTYINPSSILSTLKNIMANIYGEVFSTLTFQPEHRNQQIQRGWVQINR